MAGSNRSSPWGFITFIIMLMVIIWLTARGSLGKWLKLLVFNPPSDEGDAANDGTGKVEGTHKSGTVNSDDPKTQEKLKEEDDSALPSLIPDWAKRWLRGKG